MRIVLVHPGASWSVSDVHRGISKAMQRAGVELVDYAFDARMVMSGKFLAMVNREAKRNSPEAPQFNTADILYHASTGVIERALRHQADWVFIISALYLHHDVLVQLRRAGLKTACLLTESPYDNKREIAVASLVDVVFTNERLSVKTFEPYCHEVHYYQHCYDPEIHHPREVVEGTPQHDVVFVGTGFKERSELLRGVNWDSIDLGLYGAWQMLGSRNRLRQYVRGAITPNEIAAQLYNAAKIGLNFHRARAGWGEGAPLTEQAESMNPRCYELAATGTMFVSDARAEVADVFGDAVPTFSDAKELEDILRYYLAHEDERRRLAERLPELVRPHTFDDRVAKILDVLKHYH